MTKTNKLVVQSNSLVNGRYVLTLTQMRVVLLLITKLSRDDKDFKTYTLKAKELIEEFGLGENYRLLAVAARGLLRKTISVKENNEEFNILSYVKYNPGQGTIDIRFDPAMKPHLLDLKTNFTSFDIDNVKEIPSFYCIRLYMALKQYEKLGSRTYTVEGFREMFLIENGKYKKYADLKKRMVVPLISEINQRTDISIKLKEIKQGKKVASFIFIISAKKQQSNTANHPQQPLEGDLAIRQTLKMSYLITGDSKITDILDKYSGNFDKLEQMLRKIKGDYEKGLIKKNLGGYTYATLMNNSTIEKSLFDIEKEEVARRNAQAEEERKLKQEKEKLAAQAYIDNAMLTYNGLPSDKKDELRLAFEVQKVKGNNFLEKAYKRDVDSKAVRGIFVSFLKDNGII